MGAPVGGGRKALGETAPFELVQYAHQARALDPEPVGQVRLRQAGIGGDHDEDGVLRGTDVDRGERADEILEHPNLQAPDEIAEMLVEDPDIERLAIVRLLARCSARDVSVPMREPSIRHFAFSFAAGARSAPGPPDRGHIVVDDICCHGQQLMWLETRRTRLAPREDEGRAARIKFAQSANCAGTNGSSWTN